MILMGSNPEKRRTLFKEISPRFPWVTGTKKGSSDGVRSFGQMLGQDHSASNQKATSLAKSLGVHASDRAESRSQKRIRFGRCLRFQLAETVRTIC
jgi:uncharacterized protein DUF4142